MREREVEVNGLSLHLAEWGPSDSPVILLVHGITGNCRSWTVVGPALAAAGRHAVAVDLRGRGRSDKPVHGYSVAHHAADLLALCDTLELETVRIAGHSLGALITLLFAAAFPHRVERFALVDGGHRFPPETVGLISGALGRLGRNFPSLDAYLEAMAASPVLDWSPFWEEYYRYDAVVAPDGTVQSCVPRGAIEEEIAFSLDALSYDRLPRLAAAPCLVVRAGGGLATPESGYLLRPEDAAELTAGNGKSRELVIPAVNHYSILPDTRLAEALVAFLAQT